MKEGEKGDVLYIVKQGKAKVVIRGTAIRELEKVTQITKEKLRSHIFIAIF